VLEKSLQDFPTETIVLLNFFSDSDSEVRSFFSSSSFMDRRESRPRWLRFGNATARPFLRHAGKFNFQFKVARL
jgi:hypothetical protein